MGGGGGGGRTINGTRAAGKYRCGRFSKRGCGKRPTEPANRCTASAPFLLDFSKPIERSRSGSNTRSLHARRDHRLPRYTTKNRSRPPCSVAHVYLHWHRCGERSNVLSTSTIDEKSSTTNFSTMNRLHDCTILRFSRNVASPVELLNYKLHAA